MSYDNIPVKKDTKRKIDKMASKSESYDEFISKVLEFYEEYKQFKDFREFKKYMEFKEKEG